MKTYNLISKKKKPLWAITNNKTVTKFLTKPHNFGLYQIKSACRQFFQKASLAESLSFL